MSRQPRNTLGVISDLAAKFQAALASHLGKDSGLPPSTYSLLNREPFFKTASLYRANAFDRI